MGTRQQTKRFNKRNKRILSYLNSREDIDVNVKKEIKKSYKDSWKKTTIIISIWAFISVVLALVAGFSLDIKEFLSCSIFYMVFSIIFVLSVAFIARATYGKLWYSCAKWYHSDNRDTTIFTLDGVEQKRIENTEPKLNYLTESKYCIYIIKNKMFFKNTEDNSVIECDIDIVLNQIKNISNKEKFNGVSKLAILGCIQINNKEK